MDLLDRSILLMGAGGGSGAGTRRPVAHGGLDRTGPGVPIVAGMDRTP